MLLSPLKLGASCVATLPCDALTGRRASRFLAFWGRFAPGGAVTGLASAMVGVAAMPMRALVLKIKNAL